MLLRSTVVKKIRSTALQPPFLLQFIMTTATISAVVTLFGLLVKLCCLFLILAALQTFLLCRHNLVLLNLIMILLWKYAVVNFSHFHFWLTEKVFLKLNASVCVWRGSVVILIGRLTIAWHVTMPETKVDASNFSYTVNSRFKKVHFSFLESRVVWFKKDLCSESKSWSSKKKCHMFPRRMKKRSSCSGSNIRDPLFLKIIKFQPKNGL